MAQAEADLDIAKAELKQAQRSFERRDQLYQRNPILKRRVEIWYNIQQLPK